MRDSLTSMLTTELEKLRKFVKEDMSALIKSNLPPIQLSIESFQETADAFGMRLTTVETTAGKNFEALAKAEADIAALKATNEALLDCLDDLENSSLDLTTVAVFLYYKGSCCFVGHC